MNVLEAEHVIYCNKALIHLDSTERDRQFEPLAPADRR
jgi:hypothetical protein